MTDLIERLRLGDGTSTDHLLLLEAADALEKLGPPKREWVGLTDEEMKDALTSVDAETKRLPPGFREFAQAIETKLRSKNEH